MNVLVALAILAAAAAPSPVLVVASPKVEAYTQALEGLRRSLPEAPLVVDFGQKEALAAAVGAKPRVAIAVGAEAADVLASISVDLPVVCTMILRGDAVKGATPEARFPRLVGVVSLDVPLAALLAELRRLFPGKTRLGIIRNPAKQTLAAAALQQEAGREGFTVRTADCDDPRALLAAFLSLKNQVDFVWCLPDSLLYNSATVKPLLLASFEQRLPIIGFSESFVRAGAALGVYPDYPDIGRRTARIV
ncbi:MAG: hypothetical protein HYR60_27220, partial [Acidobacteria bacterium]|nr:hypothetical protein [Acidobacteriota bacterium]